MASSEENNIVNGKIKKYLAENINDLANVYAAHKQALVACDEEITQWKKFIKDYNVLQEKLSTYPDKTSYDEVIPIGPLAFMKGRKIHTNEILVYLGENYFAERSVKEAIVIIARRKEVCKEKFKCADRLKKIHEGWLKGTKDLAKEGEQVDIVEEISKEEYEKSKEKHREMVSKHLALMSNDEDDESSEGDLDEASIPGEMKNFEDLFKRLDVLEEEERIKDELTELGEYNEEDEGVSQGEEVEKIGSGKEKEKLRRRVSWADQLAQRKLKEEEEEEEEDEDDDDDDEGAEEDKAFENVKIKYKSRQQSLPADLISSAWEKGTKMCEEEEEEEEEEEQEAGEGESEAASPQTPSDLYKMFGAQVEASAGVQPTKGILKRKGDSFSGEECEKGVGWCDAPESITYIPSSPDEPEIPRNPPLSESPKEIKNLKPAFSYKVVARDGESTPETPTSPEEEEKEEVKETKPISRFKASRMNKDK